MCVVVIDYLLFHPEIFHLFYLCFCSSLFKSCFLFCCWVGRENKMSEGKKGEKKRGGIEIVESENEKEKRKTRKEKKEEQSGDDDESDVGEEQEIEDQEQQRKEREEEGEREQEEEMMKRRRKEEEEKKKRFECGICLELMNWEKEPRLLPCCGLSFCSLCLNKLLLLQNPSSSPSSSSSSSSSSPSSSPSSPSSSSSSSSPFFPSLKGVKCPVCREMNECESVEALSMNFLIPETVDILLSSNLISFSNQSTSGFFFFSFFLSFFFLFWGIQPTHPLPPSLIYFLFFETTKKTNQEKFKEDV